MLERQEIPAPATFRKDVKTGELRPYEVTTGSGANKKTTVYTKEGTSAQVRHSDGTVINYKDGEKTVLRNGRKAYTERAVNNGGKISYQRSEENYANNTTIVKNYNYYDRGGYGFRVYEPAIIYDPWVYRPFFYNPWYSSPYVYTRGWHNDPWYGAYGGYFSPYPSYSHPAYWLTDFLLSDLLARRHREEEDRLQGRRAEAEAATHDAEAAARNAERAAQEAREELSRLRAEKDAPITQEVKDQIKVQVEQAIKAHQDKRPLRNEAGASDRLKACRTEKTRAVPADLRRAGLDPFWNREYSGLDLAREAVGEFERRQGRIPHGHVAVVEIGKDPSHAEGVSRLLLDFSLGGTSGSSALRPQRSPEAIPSALAECLEGLCRLHI